MKTSLQLKVAQQTTITPQLQQAIKLLQLSSIDLQQQIEQVLESNPLLEIDNDDYQNQDNSTDLANLSETGLTDLSQPDKESSRINNELSDAEPYEWNDDIPKDLSNDCNWDDFYPYEDLTSSAKTQSLAQTSYDISQNKIVNQSLYEHLEWQLNLIPLSETDKTIGAAIIDAIDKNGFLSINITDIYDSLTSDNSNIELDEVIAVLHRIQQLDPNGVGSCNLQECLLLQLQNFDDCTSELPLAKTIIKNHINQLGTHDYINIIRQTKTNEERLKIALNLIKTLNPKPGSVYDSNPTEYVTPDVIIIKKNEGWCVELNNDSLTRLKINTNYSSMVKRENNKTDNLYLKNNLLEAKWFIKSLHSRNDTLLKVSNCILDIQYDFFEQGVEHLKPLVLREIADMLGMHESTISRITTQKYMHTPRGLFELKYFFSSHISSSSGQDLSSTAIRSMIKKFITNENPQKPLSDNKLTQLLCCEGVNIARRTIAKYRESIGIPPSNERKSLA